MLQQVQKIAAPLSRKAVLVSVNISQWTARKLDKKVTKEVNTSHGAAEDAGRYNKLLIEAERLTRITSIVSKARALHYAYTKPWADEGPRILPNALFSKFSTEFRELKREFAAEVDEFCLNYTKFVEERKAALNGLYDPKDYPAESEVRGKFNLDITVLPFPDADDWRADLDDETMADIRAEIEAATVKAVDVANADTVKRIVEIVGNMATRLGEYGTQVPGKKRTFFSDTLVSNVRDLAALLPAFNLNDDPKLTEITDRINRELCVEEPDTLRDNKNVRASVKQSADEILADVSKYLA